KLRETLAREAETARLSKDLATIRCDLPVALDLERLRWEGPDAEKLRPLFAELEFTSLLRDLVPSGAAPEAAHPTPRTPEETRGARAPRRRAGGPRLRPRAGLVLLEPLARRARHRCARGGTAGRRARRRRGAGARRRACRARDARAAPAPRGAPADARDGAALLRARDAARRGAGRDGAGRH